MSNNYDMVIIMWWSVIIKILSHNYNIESHYYEILRHEMLSHNYETGSYYSEIASNNYEIISHNYGKLSHYYDLLNGYIFFSSGRNGLPYRTMLRIIKISNGKCYCWLTKSHLKFISIWIQCSNTLFEY